MYQISKVLFSSKSDILISYLIMNTKPDAEDTDMMFKVIIGQRQNESWIVKTKKKRHTIQNIENKRLGNTDRCFVWSGFNCCYAYQFLPCFLICNAEYSLLLIASVRLYTFFKSLLSYGIYFQPPTGY